MEKFAGHAEFGGPGKKWRETSGQDFRRDQKHQAVGHGDQAAADEDVGFAVGVVGADELVAEAEGAAEVGSPGFFGDEGIGASFDEAALDVFGAEDAAEVRRRFIERVLDCPGPAMFFESESGGESGDAAADDGDAVHGTRLPAFGFRLPEEVTRDAEYSCTKWARFFTFSTGVSGRMPWPRLKMWPGRPAAS